MKFPVILFLLITLTLQAHSQPVWKLTKEKNGIRIFMASVPNLKFKSIRVQAVMEGTIAKLINIICLVDKMPEWVYKCKTAYIIKQTTPYDFMYYNETVLPWPASNRDLVVHMMIYPDTLHHILRITAISAQNIVAEKEGKVRIPYSKGTWHVEQTGNKINIDYTLEVDPGGTLPAWLVNMFADKGPYESFEKLMMKLKN